MADLYLHVTSEYFSAIKNQTKGWEYRLTAKWEKRLKGKVFDRIVIMWGYPKKGDPERTLYRPWQGYQVEVITHPHFGSAPVEVCAIRVN